ncbi:MAG: hypothetical protein JNK25_05200 [Phycisphaerae bacterium]|nr:hypothetical protein [Phycisphaerae bacterium]
MLRPRKVRGGIKIPTGEIAPETAWPAQRWLRLVEQAAEGQRRVEGLDEYARGGQTKRIVYLPGKVEAAVQGRADRPYAVTIALDSISHEMWDKVVATMADGALYAAKLLSGELPPNIEDVFAPLGLRLFPVEAGEVKHQCTCFEWRTENAEPGGAAPSGPVAGRWCKHVCCTAYLMAARLSSEPFLMFQMRGMEGAELIERLRQQRVIAGAVHGLTPVYTQRIAGVADAPARPIEECIEQFWDAGAGLEMVDLPLTPPPVSHPILRRLGQSPFTGAAFPLVGLLASCYDTVSEHARRGASASGEGPSAESETDDEYED